MSGYVRCHFQAQANCEDWDDVHEPTGELAEQNGKGREHKTSRLPGGFPVFHTLPQQRPDGNV